MHKKELDFITANLGDDFLDKLEKSEIIKLKTETGVSPDEIKIALQIVPRYILSFLFSNLKYREDGDVIDLDLPFADGKLMANKLSNDNYSGSIVADGKKLVEFRFRSLPSIGLLIMSTFELYDMNQIDDLRHKEQDSGKLDQLQDLIDERLRMQSLVSAVIDQKLAQREAIDQLVQLRVKQQTEFAKPPQGEPIVEHKPSKLKQFLENREKKKQDVELDKSQEIGCPDCGGILHKSNDDYIKCCICYGDLMNKKIRIKKTDNGVQLKFPKNFDQENIEMLLDTIKNK